MFGMSAEDLDYTADLIFKDKEIVKMQVTDVLENAQSHNVTMKCKVLSGDHAGKEASVFVSAKDNEAAKKRKAQWARCWLQAGVWSRDDIIAGRANLKALIGRVFTVRSSTRADKTDTTKIFQNWEEFRDEGMGAPAPATGASPAQAAAQQASF